jgi:hypothetical protein
MRSLTHRLRTAAFAALLILATIGAAAAPAAATAVVRYDPCLGNTSYCP